MPGVKQRLYQTALNKRRKNKERASKLQFDVNENGFYMYTVHLAY